MAVLYHGDTPHKINDSGRSDTTRQVKRQVEGMWFYTGFAQILSLGRHK
ncbi:MAG TPA: hypothetical protein VHN80_18470 [Kineosporiaceae bacterium]|nr:hypothetical protein [Kineosporiaceae bacterium]